MDKTIEIAKWLCDSNGEFKSLKTDEAFYLLNGVMVMAKIFLYANGQGELMGDAAITAGRNGVRIEGLEGRRAEINAARPEFSGDELHSLKTILRRFSYGDPARIMAGLMDAEPFKAHITSKAPVEIDMKDIPEPFLKSMRAIKEQFKDYSFEYGVVKVAGRNFLTEKGFELLPGEYGEISRAMKEDMLENDRMYRLSRDKNGDLILW